MIHIFFLPFSFSFQRPLFVLADRNVDMATPLHHSWTYQALIHDVLVRKFTFFLKKQKKRNNNGIRWNNKNTDTGLNVLTLAIQVRVWIFLQLCQLSNCQVYKQLFLPYQSPLRKSQFLHHNTQILMIDFCRHHWDEMSNMVSLAFENL